MKRKAVLLSIMTGVLLLSGCGENVVNDGANNAHQPHKKTNRDYKDWTWNVGAEIDISGKGFKSVTTYYSGMPESTKHTQFFIDTTPGKGFNGSNGWEIEGADYLIEDDKLYKSLSDTEWKWQQIGSASTKTVGTGNDKRTTFTAGSVVAKAINSKKVNIFLETYDKDWNGAYLTVVMKDTDVHGVAATTKTLKTLAEADLAKNERKLSKYIETSDKKSAIMFWSLTNAPGVGLTHYSLDGENLSSKLIDFVTQGDIQNIALKDDSTLTYKYNGDNLGVYDIVTYDLVKKEIVSRIKKSLGTEKDVIVSLTRHAVLKYPPKKRVFDATISYVYKDGKVHKSILDVNQKITIDKKETISTDHQEKVVGANFKIRLAHEDPKADINLYGYKIKNPKYTYNDKGQITEVIDDNDRKIIYTYNALGQVVEKSHFRLPVGSRTFTYDAAGHMTAETRYTYKYGKSELFEHTYTWGSL